MPENNRCSEEILTLSEACDFLKISIPTMRNWLRDGRIVGYKINRDWRFLKSELLARLQKKELGAKSD